MKITEYPSVTELDDDNVFILDGTSGTKKIAKSDLIYALYDNIPEMHNHLYRGKDLGASYTTTQKQEVSNGTFHDMWVGDYWTSESHKWYICGFNCLGSPTYNDNHVVIMGDALAENIPWDNTTSGPPMGKVAYIDSTIYKTALPNYMNSSIPNIFKNNFYDRKERLVSFKNQTDYSVKNTTDVVLHANVPRISNIFGTVNSAAWIRENGSSWNNGVDISLYNAGGKFPIFDFVKPYELFGNKSFWLQDDNGPLSALYTVDNGGGVSYTDKVSNKYMVAYFVISG